MEKKDRKQENSKLNADLDHTMMFRLKNETENGTRELLVKVYQALEEKGYSPVNQIVGYLLSGDPAYITSYNNARNMIKRLDRNELLEELVTFYLGAK